MSGPTAKDKLYKQLWDLLSPHETDVVALKNALRRSTARELDTMYRCVVRRLAMK